MKQILLFLIFTFTAIDSFSSHNAGGEIEYECIGPRTWKIRLTLYRDCSGVQLCTSPACPQSMIARPNTTLNPSGCIASPNQVNFSVNFVRVQDVGLSNVTVCGNSAKNGCNNMGTVSPGPYTPSIELYVFEGTLNLNLPSLNAPNTCPYWDVYWENCCRNAGILNLVGSSGLGFRIGATINIFWQSGSPCKNNSPLFKNETLAFLCSGQTNTFSLGAVDPDNDSLTYEISPAQNQGGSNVPYQQPYSATYPFPLNASAPPHVFYPQPNGPYIVIDTARGDISLFPVNNSQNYVFSVINVTVKQWGHSNGLPVLLGITQREMLLYVGSCISNNIPRITTNPSLSFGAPKLNYTVLAGQNLCFTISAKDTDVYPTLGRYDTTFISWNQSIVRPGKLIFGPAYSTGQGHARPREDVWQFCWQTEPSDVRSLPYYFTVNTMDNRCPNPGRVQTTFSVKVLPQFSYFINKTNLRCGTVKYDIFRTPPFNSISAATLRVAKRPNDINFSQGFRNVTSVNINPIIQPQDTIGQPKLMYTDSFSYNEPGRYYMRFSYTMQGGEPITVLDSIDILQDSILVPVIVAQGDTVFCSGQNVILQSQFNHPRYKLQWQRNDTSIVGALQNSITVSSSGTYQLQVMDTLIKCNNLSNKINVLVNQRSIPTLSISGNQVICNGDSISVSSSISNAISYQWINGGLPVPGANSNTLFLKTAGNYRLVVVSQSGCRDTSNTIQIIVINRPLITSVSSASRCGEGKLLLGATANEGEIKWYGSLVGGNTLETGPLFNTPFLQNTSTYYVEAFTNGCSSLPRIPVTATINPSVTIGEITGLKTGLGVNLNYDYNVTQQLNHNYFWELDNGNIVNGQGTNAIKVQWLSAGSGLIKARISNQFGCTDSVSNLVIIGNQPSPVVLSFAPTTAASGTVVSITGNHFNSATAVKFGGVDARNFTVINNTTITAVVDTGATGDVMVATPSGNATLPGFIYQKNTGLKETVLEDVIVYPNPVTSQLQIELNQSMRIVNIELRDVAGKLVRSSIIPAGCKATMMDLSDLTSSVYLLHLSTDNGVKTIKLIKY